MKIVIGVAHPKHAHIFKNPASKWREEGHEIYVIAINKGETGYLLKKYFNSSEYTIIGESKDKLHSKIIHTSALELKSLKLLKRIEPNIAIGRAIPHLIHASAACGTKYIIFEDTEMAKLLHRITVPFCNAIVTPKNFIGDFGKKHIRFDGFFELAYLHPEYFKPDRSVLDLLNIAPDERYIVMRTISWDAYHDAGLRGLSDYRDAIKRLEKYARVIVISENNDRFLEKYRVSIPPEKIHSLLYYADLYLGEGGTMAVESAILGTPSIHVEATASGLPTGLTSGNFIELKNKYGLLEFYSEQESAVDKAINFLEDKKIKKRWNKKRNRLLKEKIDVSKWIYEFVTEFPL
ncbi:Uncharacterized protein conserved in archaea [Geoglobus ahangari]|uniref:Uncharacterized protein conserved in archaea n=1 Tax=Geoglobus ahangari TaxID=113653 RepID=A0A0F7II35_9EURY|nr:DUF354 domain-containing protein [Geoglobus ahangari]AKG92430.1 Uncharacterized protein conserved in archaea [Geoglobus ahangari]